MREPAPIRGRVRFGTSPPPRSHPPRSQFRPGAAALTLLLLGGCEEVAVNLVPVVGVQLSPSLLTLTEGDQAPLHAVLTGPGGQVVSGRQIQWTSEHPAIASVSNEGVVRGESGGVTRVRAVSAGVEGEAEVRVLRAPMIALPIELLPVQATAGSPTPIEFEIPVVNSGDGEITGLALSVALADPPGPSWLTAFLDDAETPTSLRVVVSPSGLPAGTYRGTVRISSPLARNSPYALEVELTLTPQPPAVAVDPGSVVFSAPPGAREPATFAVAVVNAGGGTLHSLESSVEYAEGPSTGWLVATLEGTTAPTELTLEASAESLGVGIYRAVVRVTSPTAPGSVGTVEVRFDVLPPGAPTAGRPTP
jgi:hypothetical protein